MLALDILPTISNVPRFLPLYPLPQSLKSTGEISSTILHGIEIYNDKLRNQVSDEVFDTDLSRRKS